MTLTEFINRVIDDGVEAAKQSYAEGTLKRDGAVAGFEACRGKGALELAQALDNAAKAKDNAYRDEKSRYWYFVTFHAEIEWVCNVLSAVLQNQGLAPIVTPTARGFQMAASIVGVSPLPTMFS